MKEIQIAVEDDNQRLDKFLKKYFKAAGSGFLYKMMRKKNITLNKKKVSGTEILRSGDTIQVFFSDETFAKMRAESEVSSAFDQLKEVPYDLQVIHEDDKILVINKPAGILSQKAIPSDISMNEMILSYLIHTNQLTMEQFALFHPSVANRLDRNTSGILLAGKNLHGQQELSNMLNQRTLKKYYHCIVKGCIETSEHLCGYLLKDPKTNQVRILSEPELGAKKIETAYRPLCHTADVTLLEVHLITGRSHQIRSHLASIGHPIAGDPKYGDFKWNRMLEQKYGVEYQLLHAYSITFSDGTTFTAEEPDLYRHIMKG